MKHAIFGDVHGNLEGLEAVLSDARAADCDGYACVGDIVGYGASPKECLRIVRDMGCPVVKGDSDEQAVLDTSLEGLNPLAKRAMEWTRAQLDEEERGFLRSLDLVRQVRDFTIVHATLEAPGSWVYVTSPFDAMASLTCQFTQLCFYGHTHTPRIYVDADRAELVEENSVRLEMGRKYFINVGSAGWPRDGDWRVSYAIYDAESQEVSIRRLEYDIRKARDKINDAGLNG